LNQCVEYRQGFLRNPKHWFEKIKSEVEFDLNSLKKQHKFFVDSEDKSFFYKGEVYQGLKYVNRL
jgi:hypothetical protein